MKRVVDFLLAALGLAVMAPLFLLIALAIWADSGGPVFFRQTRVGLNGRLFRLWKFRTMANAGSSNGPILTSPGDRRVTRIGRLLRRHKLDELPQLLNVMLGDMSMVGPRPELPELVVKYSDEEWGVLTVRPGITGPTQLAWSDEEDCYPAGVDVVRYYVDHVMRRKLRSDLAYVRSRSLRGDTRLLLHTLALVLRRGASVRTASPGRKAARPR